MADATLREFNYRWNLSMQARFLGLPADLCNFYELERIERLQVLAREIHPSDPLYPAWKSSLTMADTGERFGLPPRASSKKGTSQPGDALTGTQSADQSKSPDLDAGAETSDGTAGMIVNADQEREEEAEEEMQEEEREEEASGGDGEGDVALVASRDGLPKVKRSAKWYFEATGLRVPTQSLNREEKAYFEANWQKYMVGGVRTEEAGDDNINFSKMAEEWSMYAELVPSSRLKPKRAPQLKRYWKRYKREANTKLTIATLQQKLKDLQRELR